MTAMLEHEKFMKQALVLAKISSDLGEVPVGALAVLNQDIVGIGINRRELCRSSIEHAEIAAIREASARLGRWRLTDVTIYSTLEPCIMCAGALVHARVKNLVYGAKDIKFGAIESLYTVASDLRLNHQIHIISGVMAEESTQLLKDFFRGLRGKAL